RYSSKFVGHNLDTSLKPRPYVAASFWEETLQTVERRGAGFGNRASLHLEMQSGRGEGRTSRSNGSGEVGGVLDITSGQPGFMNINKYLSINVKHFYRFSLNSL
ncbi:MAG: hypothetical protein KDA39_01055, partial [Hyphomonas sp.]|nr:hypothetical protein [Hyphomonas sp.]